MAGPWVPGYTSYQPPEVTEEDLAELRRQLADLAHEHSGLRSAVARLLTILMKSGQLDEELHGSWIQEFTGGRTKAEAITKAATQAHVVIGKLRCPKCNGVVDDIEGVHDETCTWCGYQFHTDR